MRKNYEQDSLSDQSALSKSGATSGNGETAYWSGTSPKGHVAQTVPTLLIEPNTLLREGLKRILSETPYHLVATTSSLDEAPHLDMAGSAPVLFIVDAANDHHLTFQQVHQFKELQPSARIAVLVDRYDPKQVMAAFQAGADAYLMKSVSCEVLVKSLDLVMLGESVFPSAVLSLLREHVNPTEKEAVDYSDPEPLDIDDEQPPKGLSVRETVILRCLMEGDSNKLIARKFDITEATVKVHVKAILRKIRAKNRTQAAIWAASHLPSNGGMPTR
jgi:two-component system, NarL family, nitrate/nitrite response regulator NarL